MVNKKKMEKIWPKKISNFFHVWRATSTRTTFGLKIELFQRSAPSSLPSHHHHHCQCQCWWWGWLCSIEQDCSGQHTHNKMTLKHSPYMCSCGCHFMGDFCLFNSFFLKKVAQPRPLFCSFLFFSNTILQKKTVGFSGIRTRIVGVEGQQTDHMTTTTALLFNS